MTNLRVVTGKYGVLNRPVQCKLKQDETKEISIQLRIACVARRQNPFPVSSKKRKDIEKLVASGNSNTKIV
jgi:hypothetical protein